MTRWGSENAGRRHRGLLAGGPHRGSLVLRRLLETDAVGIMAGFRVSYFLLLACVWAMAAAEPKRSQGIFAAANDTQKMHKSGVRGGKGSVFLRCQSPFARVSLAVFQYQHYTLVSNCPHMVWKISLKKH